MVKNRHVSSKYNRPTAMNGQLSRTAQHGESDMGGQCAQVTKGHGGMYFSNLGGGGTERSWSGRPDRVRDGLFAPTTDFEGQHWRIMCRHVRRNRSEEHTSELQSLRPLVCRLL